MRFLRSMMLATTSALFGACTMVGAPAPVHPPEVTGAPLPAVVRGPSATPVGSLEAPPEPSRVTTRVVEIALESIGTPYVWGGSGGTGFDCSGLIQYAYAQVGVLLPRISRAQIGAGSPVAPEPRLLRPGDVLGFTDDGDGSTDHVGLYIGAGEFIHSSSSGVRVSELSNPYWRQRLVAARRIVD